MNIIVYYIYSGGGGGTIIFQSYIYNGLLTRSIIYTNIYLERIRVLPTTGEYICINMGVVEERQERQFLQAHVLYTRCIEN